MQINRIFIFNRHGERMPIFQTDDEEYNIKNYIYLGHWPEYRIQSDNTKSTIEDVAYLSNQGYIEQQKLGDKIKFQYSELLNEIKDSNQIYLRYTDFSRTYYTMCAFISTFLPERMHDTVDITNTSKRSIDPFLFSLPNDKHRQQHRNQFYSKFTEYESIRKQFNQKYNNTWHWNRIYDNLHSRQQLNQNLDETDQKIYKISKDIWRQYWYDIYFSNNRDLLHIIFCDLKTEIKKMVNARQYKIQYVACHDSTICAIASMIFNLNDELMPNYSDYVIIEELIQDGKLYYRGYMKLGSIEGYQQINEQQFVSEQEFTDILETKCNSPIQNQY